MTMKAEAKLHRSPKLEPNHQMLFSAIPRTPLFEDGDVLPLGKEYS